MFQLPSMRASAALLRTDALRLARDRFLIGAGIYILATTIAMRFALPWVRDEVLARSGYELAVHYPMMASYLTIVLAAVMVGMIGGFLLLETREDGTIRALLVSPVPLLGYLSLGGALLSLATALITLAEATILGLALPPGAALWSCALLGGPSSVIVALVLASFAHNKVEAFALMKFVSFAGLLPVGLWFVPETWHPLGAMYPPFCICKAWWLAEAGSGLWWAWAAAGGLGALLWLAVLMRYFHRVAYR